MNTMDAHSRNGLWKAMNEILRVLNPPVESVVNMWHSAS